ncbi:hypothetical protein BGY98DRAFT_58232 [Russula aff. rugulosa BPL654]|nr:hypothetical protein BGY98DRAFT_58232 [Russula aff. rugulosa BPL654]
MRICQATFSTSPIFVPCPDRSTYITSPLPLTSLFSLFRVPPLYSSTTFVMFQSSLFHPHRAAPPESPLPTKPPYKSAILPFTSYPTFCHGAQAPPRRPISPSSLPCLDVSNGQAIPPRDYSRPPTGHDPMRLFSPQPPEQPLFLKQGSTNLYFRHQEH